VEYAYATIQSALKQQGYSMTRRQKSTMKRPDRKPVTPRTQTAKAARVRVVSNTKQGTATGFFASRQAMVFAVGMFVVVGMASLLWAKAATTTSSLWSNSQIPKTLTDTDNVGVELGTKFQSQYAGKVTSVRFYKGPQNTGTHTGSLWTNDGRKLAGVTFKNETASGWQTADLAVPVDITANTTYIVSYYAPKGRYSSNNNYFTTSYTNAPLKAPRNAGVYHYGSTSGFPNQTYAASNYWVDVVVSTSRFFPTEKPQPPTGLQGSYLNNGVSLGWTPSTSAGIANYEVFRNGTRLVVLGASATGYRDTAVVQGNTYSYQVRAVDINGVASDFSGSVSVKVTATPAPEPAPTPTPTPTPAPTPTPTPTPVPSEFPGPTNTGYKNAPGYPGSLKACSSAIQSNTTYSFCDFGAVDVGSKANPVSNVTFYGCRFKDVAVNEALVKVYGDNLTFDYSSFEPAVAAPPTPFNKSYQYGISANGSYYTFAQKFTVTNSDFWGFGNAIDTHGSTQDKPHVFRNNYIHDAADDGGGIYHTDGIGDESGSGSGSYIVLDHNTLVSNGNTNGIAFQEGKYDHVTITNNLISGWGYAVALWAPAPYTTFTGNTFSTQLKPVWGPLYPQSFWSSTGSVWKNNKWLVPSGAAYGNASDNGKYWTPNGPSATDY
jgi:hypothetical protein